MGLVTVVQSILLLGLPLLILSWAIFNWLYTEGKLDREDQHRVIKKRLKNMKGEIRKGDSRKARFFYDKWTLFGSGFYGLAGLWTFVIIEVRDLIGFLTSGAMATLFDQGLTQFVIDFFVNQLGNSIQALLWFSYWPSGGQSILIWVAVAYLGYWAGIEIARRQLSMAHLRSIRTKFSTENTGEQNHDSDQTV